MKSYRESSQEQLAAVGSSPGGGGDASALQEVFEELRPLQQVRVMGMVMAAT